MELMPQLREYRHRCLPINGCKAGRTAAAGASSATETCSMCAATPAAGAATSAVPPCPPSPPSSAVTTAARAATAQVGGGCRGAAAHGGDLPRRLLVVSVCLWIELHEQSRERLF